MSDIDGLPVPTARTALEGGIRLVGDNKAIEADDEQIAAEYEETATDRERDRWEFIDRLAKGDI